MLLTSSCTYCLAPNFEKTSCSCLDVVVCRGKVHLTSISMYQCLLIPKGQMFRKALTKKKTNNEVNKKDLLRERKRHTARRVSSTPSAVLSWGHPISGQGYPISGWGYLISGWGTPSLAGVSLCPDLAGVPPLSWPGWGTPLLTWPGYPPSLSGWGNPPPREWTNKQTETITFPIFRM